MKRYFVTGTDTEVGKTYVTCQLLRAAANAGLKCIGYKPVSAGCERIGTEWINEDAAALQAHSSVALPIEQINPIAFKQPIAPHIAAAQEGSEISERVIIEQYQQLHALNPDLLLVEGAGGWRLPLSETRTMPDVVKALELDVLVVVGMRLGCLNHALLTVEAIERDGLHVVGWVANQLSDDMPAYHQNLAYLKRAIDAPLIAEVPWHNAPQSTLMQAALKQII